MYLKASSRKLLAFPFIFAAKFIILSSLTAKPVIIKHDFKNYPVKTFVFVNHILVKP